MIIRLRHGRTILAQITGFLRGFCHGTREHYIHVGKVGPDPGRQCKPVPVLTIDVGKHHVDSYGAILQELADLIRVGCFNRDPTPIRPSGSDLNR